jgi:hypothetical protein
MKDHTDDKYYEKIVVRMNEKKAKYLKLFIDQQISKEEYDELCLAATTEFDKAFLEFSAENRLIMSAEEIFVTCGFNIWNPQ